MPAWIDRSDNGKTGQVYWLGEDRLVCLHRHVKTPGSWFVTCDLLGVAARKLSSTHPDDARTEALRYLKKHVELLSFRFAFLTAVP